MNQYSFVLYIFLYYEYLHDRMAVTYISNHPVYYILYNAQYSIVYTFYFNSTSAYIIQPYAR